MKYLPLFAILLLAACGTDAIQQPPFGTSTVATGSALSVGRTTTDAVAATTSTSPPETDNGGHSIGITDSVTIIVIDPEDHE